MSELNMSYSLSSAALEDSLTEASSVYEESGPEHVSSFDISNTSELEPRGLDHNGVLGKPEAAAEEECGGRRSAASCAKIFIYRQLYPSWPTGGASILL